MADFPKRQTTRSKWNRALELQAFIDDPKHGMLPAQLPTDQLEAFAAAMEELETLPNVRFPDRYEIVEDEN